MHMKRTTLTRIATALAASGLAAAAWPADYQAEFKGCTTSEVTVIGKVGDVSIGSNVTHGSVNVTGGLGDKFTHNCRVLWAASKEGSEFTNRCVNTDKDGDQTITMTTGTPKGFEWKYLSGTGKYQGITGGGKGQTVAQYPRAGNVAASCWQGKGAFSVPR